MWSSHRRIGAVDLQLGRGQGAPACAALACDLRTQEPWASASERDPGNPQGRVAQNSRRGLRRDFRSDSGPGCGRGFDFGAVQLPLINHVHRLDAREHDSPDNLVEALRLAQFALEESPRRSVVSVKDPDRPPMDGGVIDEHASIRRSARAIRPTAVSRRAMRAPQRLAPANGRVSAWLSLRGASP